MTRPRGKRRAEAETHSALARLIHYQRLHITYTAVHHRAPIDSTKTTSLVRWDRTLGSEQALRSARSYDLSLEDLPSLGLSESGTSIPLRVLSSPSSSPFPLIPQRHATLSHHRPKILRGRLHRLIPPLPTSHCLTRHAAASGLPSTPCPYQY